MTGGKGPGANDDPDHVTAFPRACPELELGQQAQFPFLTSFPKYILYIKLIFLLNEEDNTLGFF